MQEIDRIKKVLEYEGTKEIWRNQYSSTEWQEASKLNDDLYGMPLNRSCMKCLDDLFLLLHWRVNKTKVQYKSQNKESMEEKKQFVLKPDQVVMSHRFPHPLDKNSSDEDLIKLLRINKKHINKFEKFPGNWEELVDAEDSKKKTPAAPAEDPTKFKKVEEFEAFATKHNIDISSASNNKERLALIQEGLKPKTPAAPAEKTDEEKAQERYAERQAFLIAEGWDATDDIVFSKGEHTLQKGEVWAQTDEEFKASLPTE